MLYHWSGKRKLQFRLQQPEQSEFFQFREVHTEEYHGEAESQNMLKYDTLKSNIKTRS